MSADAKRPASEKLQDFRSKHDPRHVIEEPTAVYDRLLAPSARAFIIVCAQNATPVDDQWWSVLLRMAELKGAELLAVPIRYRNPNSRWSASQADAEWWDAAVRPYLWNRRLALNDNVVLLGDIKVVPTAANPLAGVDALSGASSGIVGHTKLQLRTAAVQSNRLAKILTTTGACTVPNYTDSRVGRLGAFHHSLSAVLVEVVDAKQFHLRQLHFDRATATCTDIDQRYSAAGVEPAPRALSVTCGDTHVRVTDPLVDRATFGPGGLVELVRPRYVVCHDLLDGETHNPHQLANPFGRIARRQSGLDDVRAEVLEAIDFVAQRTPADGESVVVASNHDDFLRRWILTHDWKTDPVNAAFYLETAYAMVHSTRRGPGGTEYASPFHLWLERVAPPRVRALHVDESLVLGEVEHGMHGDRGPNGARGSVANLKRVGLKSTSGHSHSPAIEEGHYRAGTSSVLQLEYNHGLSSWLQAHVLEHADGKRQIIIFVNGLFRA